VGCEWHNITTKNSLMNKTENVLDIKVIKKKNIVTKLSGLKEQLPTEYNISPH
jgi:hypothetical protein